MGGPTIDNAEHERNNFIRDSFFTDTAEVPALAFTNRANSTMSNYTSIVLGATWYQQAGTILSPYVMWIDDLAIDENRIGCQ